MNNTVSFTVSSYPSLFTGEGGDQYIARHVKEWLMHETPGAYIQNVCAGHASIQFKSQEDAVKFKMFVL